MCGGDSILGNISYCIFFFWVLSSFPLKSFWVEAYFPRGKKGQTRARGGNIFKNKESRKQGKGSVGVRKLGSKYRGKYLPHPLTLWDWSLGEVLGGSGSHRSHPGWKGLQGVLRQHLRCKARFSNVLWFIQSVSRWCMTGHNTMFSPDVKNGSLWFFLPILPIVKEQILIRSY